MKGSYFGFFPFAWKNKIGNTMIKNKSYLICYVRGRNFLETGPNHVCTCSFTDINVGEEFQNLFFLNFELQELQILHLHVALPDKTPLIYHGLYLRQVLLILMQCLQKSC